MVGILSARTRFLGDECDRITMALVSKPSEMHYREVEDTRLGKRKMFVTKIIVEIIGKWLSVQVNDRENYTWGLFHAEAK